MPQMKDEEKRGNGADLICAKCQKPLELQAVMMTYVGSTFPVSLYACSECGQAYVPAVLARNSMLEVQRTLEDK